MYEFILYFWSNKRSLGEKKRLKNIQMTGGVFNLRTVHTASHKQAVMETSRSENHFNFYM